MAFMPIYNPNGCKVNYDAFAASDQYNDSFMVFNKSFIEKNVKRVN
jgi:hypothetical protein